MSFLKPKFLQYCFLVLFSLLLGACSSSDSGTDTGAGSGGATLSGTAAVGLAVADKTVTVVDAAGVTVTTTTDSKGKYSVEVDNSSNPYMIKVDAGSGELYSFAFDVGVANVTPMTNLALHEANKNGATYIALSSLFSAFKDHNGQITADKLNAAMSKVNANLGTVLSAESVANTFDFFTTAFSADGTGIDAVLDTISVAIGTGGTVSDITIDIIGGSAFTFDPDIDISAFTIGTGSGGSGTTLPAGVASEILDMEFGSAAAGAPYNNGDIVKFTFSSSGSLMLTEQYTVFADSFTEAIGAYVWDNGTHKYELNLLSGAIYEVNVMDSSSGAFLGQFTPVSGSGGSSSSQYTLTITGDYSYTASGFPITAPINVTLSGPFAAPSTSDVESSVTSSYGASGTVTVTPGSDTDAQKSFTVSFTGLVGVSDTASYNLTYTYNKI